MSKFNYEDANPKNVFSGEDGILFVHQRENGENCIEINSDNLIECVKTHIASIFKNDFEIGKLWFRFKTPHGQISFNVEEFAFIMSKMVTPFFDEDEKKKFNDLMEEVYEQIISIEKGEVLWKILEARCNEGIWNNLDAYEGNDNMEKYGKFLVSRYYLANGSANPIEMMKKIYAELIPETYKEIMNLVEAGQIIDALKPIVNVFTLGIAHELINNTNIVSVISDFISKNLDKISILNNIFGRPKQHHKGFEVAPGFESQAKEAMRYASPWINPVENYFNDMRKEANASIPTKSKEELIEELKTIISKKANEFGGVLGEKYLERLCKVLEKAETMTAEELTEELKEFYEFEKSLRLIANVRKATDTGVDFKEIKNKFIKEVDSLLEKSSKMDKDEFIKTVKSYKENFAQIFDLYQAKKELNDEMMKLRF